MAETMTLTLSEFLLARAAEDEAGVDGMFHAEELGYPLTDHERRLTTRVLAECEAKRRIVEQLQPPPRMCFSEPPRQTTLRFLALPYADHSDYRDEWRP